MQWLRTHSLIYEWRLKQVKWWPQGSEKTWLLINWYHDPWLCIDLRKKSSLFAISPNLLDLKKEKLLKMWNRFESWNLEVLETKNVGQNSTKFSNHYYMNLVHHNAKITWKYLEMIVMSHEFVEACLSRNNMKVIISACFQSAVILH